MKEDLGTLINHKIRLDGTLDTNIFKILFAIITAMTRLKIIFVVGSSWQFRLGGDLRRRIGAQPPTVSNEYKLLKVFCNFNMVWK